MVTIGQFRKYPIQQKAAQPPDVSQQDQAAAPTEESPYRKYPINQQKNEPEPKQNDFVRNAERQLHRVGEVITGIPGDVEKLIREVSSYGGGEGVLPIPEEAAKYKQEGHATESLLPGRADIREFTKKKQGDKFEPQSFAEKKLDDVTTDLTDLLIGPSKLSAGKRLLLGIGQSIAGNIGQELVRVHGGKEGAQNLSKIGIWTLAGMLAPAQTAKQLESELYNESRTLLPKGADMPSHMVKDGLDDLIKNSELGLGDPTAPGKKQVLAFIDQVKKKGESGRIGIDELVELKKDANRHIEQVVRDTALKKKDARKLFKPVSNIIGQSIEQYGQTQNAPFLKAWQSANEVYGTIAESKKISEWIVDLLPFTNLKVTPEKLFTGVGLSTAAAGALAKPELANTIATGYAGLAGLSKGIEKVSQIVNSPILAHHYADVIKNAAKQDAAATIRSLEKFDSELAKEQEKKSKQDNRSKKKNHER